MKVTIDASRCNGNAACVLAAPDVFALGDSGLAEVLLTEVPGARQDELRHLVAVCPTRAIAIQEP